MSSKIFSEIKKFILENKKVFIPVWLICFSLILLFFIFLGIFPFDDADDSGVISGGSHTSQNQVNVSVSTTTSSELVDRFLPDIEQNVGPHAPTRVIIDSLGISIPISNPETRDIAILDEALKFGAVKYPGSGELNEVSNILVFAHSSNWPVVRNQAFKAFNGIETLKAGDEIVVLSKDRKNIYRVTTVRVAKADDALVVLSNKTKMLTLSTCDSFGQKQDRFVVEAEFLSAELF